MFFENQYRDNRPLGNFQGLPIYLTTIVVAIIVVGLVFSAFAGFYTAAGLFAFSPDLVWRHAQIWRLVTYLAVGQVNFFTLFNLLFLYSFGRDCEREMGRARYAGFLAVLTLTPVAIGTVLWLSGLGGGLVGTTYLSIGLVVAFAAMYPNVMMWGSIPMKFIAIACVFLAAVGHISDRDQIGLGITLLNCAVSFGYIRGMRAGFFSGFSWTRNTRESRREPKLRVLPTPPARDDVASDMDALLDKIAKSGFDSLTASEKARLQAAREQMLKRGRR